MVYTLYTPGLTSTVHFTVHGVHSAHPRPHLPHVLQGQTVQEDGKQRWEGGGYGMDFAMGGMLILVGSCCECCQISK